MEQSGKLLLERTTEKGREKYPGSWIDTKIKNDLELLPKNRDQGKTASKRNPSSWVELERALRERLAVINDHALREAEPERHLEMLGKVSREIERISHSLPPNTHPRLLHFLERASYSKALEFLENL